MPHDGEPAGQHDHQHVAGLAPGLLATVTAYDDGDGYGPTSPFVTLALEYEQALGGDELRDLIERATALLAIVETSATVATAATAATVPAPPVDVPLVVATARAKLHAGASITAPELAAILGIATVTVHAQANAGRYPSQQPTGPGGARRFSRADVEAIEAKAAGG